MMQLRWVIFSMICGFSGLTNAAIDVYEFNQPEKEVQFLTLVDELRCPKCQNQNVKDSSAPLAKDIKDRVYTLVNEGKTNQEITDYMVERYGEFVTYRPRMSTGVALLWAAPACAGLIALIVLLARRKSSPSASPADPLRLQTLLDKYSDSSDNTSNK